MPDGLSHREGNLSVLLLYYLRGTPSGIGHHSEHLEFGLFTPEEMTRAFKSAGMEVRYDSEGLMCRGIYIGVSVP